MNADAHGRQGYLAARAEFVQPLLKDEYFFLVMAAWSLLNPDQRRQVALTALTIRSRSTTCPAPPIARTVQASGRQVPKGWRVLPGGD